MTTLGVHREPLFGRPILGALAENWWLLLLRGFAGIGFGLLAFLLPGLALVTLTVFWGVYLTMDGVVALAAAAVGGPGMVGSRGWLAVAGVAGIAAGAMTFAWPGLTAQILLTIIAFWAIVTGILQIVGAILLRREIAGEWVLGLSGILLIAFGALMLERPMASALALIWLVGAFAIVIGCNYVGFAFRLRKLRQSF